MQCAPDGWEQALAASQAEIARLDPHPFYLEAYRNQERTYWTHIPRWIWQDWKGQGARRCLDIGCAYGTLALFARLALDCEVYCTDWTDRATSSGLIQEHGIHFRMNNIELDPFPWDLQFDLIIFTEVLEHLNFHPLPTLKRLLSLLTPAGRLYLSTPDAEEWGRATHYRTYRDMPAPSRDRPLVDDHVCLFTANEVTDLVREAGLTVARLERSPGVLHRHLNMTLARSDS